MARKSYLLLIIVFVAAFSFGLFVSRAKAKPPEVGERSDGGEGGVTVAAKLSLEKGIGFDFFLDTHLVDLTGFDVPGNSELIAGGKAYLPSDWVENEGSEHHRSGKLVFKAPAEGKIELIVKNLAGVNERRLVWEP